MGVNEKLTAIAEAIREKTGGTEALSLDGMAAAVRALQIDGGDDAFWDAFQSMGAAKDYSCSFGSAWSEATFKPKYNIVPTNAYMMFRQNEMRLDLAKHLETLGVVLDTSQCKNLQYMFSMSLFTRIGRVDLSASTSTFPGNSLFQNCVSLKTIDEIVLKTGSKGEFDASCFSGCTALEDLKLIGALTGTIDLHWSTKLSKNSIRSVLEAGGQGHVIKPNAPILIFSLDAVNKAYETSDGANDGSTGDEWKSLITNYSFTINLL